VNLWLGGAVVSVAVACAVVLMVLVRRRAPVGGFFTDTDRAAGIFGVLGTFFAVVVAFVIFLAFESYVTAKDKAGQEAVAVTELGHTARSFPSPQRQELPPELICYARAVIEDEWPAMKEEQLSNLVEGWVDRIDAAVAGGRVERAKPVAYAHWLGENATRREGRRGRAAEARPFVPAPLWMVLIVGAFLLVGFTCLFADPGEPLFIQAAAIAAITTVVVSGLLVVRFLDRPYENQSGSIKPVEMRRTLDLLESDQRRVPDSLRIPCDARGRPAL
jgi:hypothetical protein